ncbi:MAG TPA: gamma-glutamylcyclotransferase family protein [Blastocatellia bacterium]|nr:gamma-glutamylcyclotransferase family protein [Blastocatellia bacterium]
MSEFLFVYGTLRPELAPAEMKGVIGQLRPVAPASVRGRLYDLGEYPGALVDEAAGTVIVGSVFELPEDVHACFAALDEYEGFDPGDPEAGLFLRRQHIITLNDGRALSCWIYVCNRAADGLQPIAGGDYLKWRAEQLNQNIQKGITDN